MIRCYSVNTLYTPASTAHFWNHSVPAPSLDPIRQPLAFRTADEAGPQPGPTRATRWQSSLPCRPEPALPEELLLGTDHSPGFFLGWVSPRGLLSWRPRGSVFSIFGMRLLLEIASSSRGFFFLQNHGWDSLAGPPPPGFCIITVGKFWLGLSNSSLFKQVGFVVSDEWLSDNTLKSPLSMCERLQWRLSLTRGNERMS